MWGLKRLRASSLIGVLTVGITLGDKALWAWSGGLQDDAIRIKSRLDNAEITPSRVLVEIVQLESGDRKVVQAQQVGKHGMADFAVDGLVPQKKYQYKIWVTAENDSSKLPGTDALLGNFETPAPLNQPYSFSFGFASCADNHSNAVIFDVIREHNPLFFLHTGDLHYGNVEVNDQAIFHSMYDQVMQNSRQKRMFSAMPLVYMWDDHDFGPNNSHEGSPGREASISAFVEAVPSYPLAKYSSPGELKSSLALKKKPSIFFSFTIGRVRFIVTDTSSSKVPKKTALGKAQLQWFKNEMLHADENFPLIIWVNTMPWVSNRTKWGEFLSERDDIVTFIKNHGIHQKLIMLSGDAHMLALDDGENVPGSFPVFQAAALDAKPTSKGGPYSHGIFPGRQQYGWIEILDSPSQDMPCVDFRGRRVNPISGEEREVLRFNTCDHSNDSPRDTYYPSPRFVEKLWKKFKKRIVPRIYGGDDLMVFFDGFSISAGMFFGRLLKFLLPSFLAFIGWKILRR